MTKTINNLLLFISIFSFVAFSSAFFFFPDIVNAQGAGGFVPCSGNDCTFCHLIDLGNELVGYLIGIIFVIFGVMFFAAGFSLVTSGGNQSKLDDAKKMLTNALIGMLIVFAAWLIVDTLLKATIGGGTTGNIVGETSFGPWNEIECEAQQQPSGINPPGSGGGGGGGMALGDNCTPNLDGTQTCVTYPNEQIEGQNCVPTSPPLLPGYECSEILPLGTGGGGGGGTNQPGSQLSTTAAGQVLSGANISVSSSGGCTDSNNSSCTGINFNQGTIDAILNIRNQCPTCDMVITGGTETGHSGGTNPGTHGGGDKFDLRLTDSVNNYIRGSDFVSGPYTSVYGNTRNGYLNTSAGVFCVNEGDHWDCVRI